VFSSFALAVSICFVAGTLLVVALAARARADDSIASVLYAAEQSKQTR
jgi:hypothetical protein